MYFSGKKKNFQMAKKKKLKKGTRKRKFRVGERAGKDDQKGDKNVCFTYV